MLRSDFEFRLDKVSPRFGRGVSAIFCVEGEEYFEYVTAINDGKFTVKRQTINDNNADDEIRPTMDLTIPTLRSMVKAITEFFDKEGIKANLGNELEKEIEGLKAQLDIKTEVIIAKEKHIDSLEKAAGNSHTITTTILKEAVDGG